MRPTKAQFDRLCGRNVRHVRLIDQGDTPLPLFDDEDLAKNPDPSGGLISRLVDELNAD